MHNTVLKLILIVVQRQEFVRLLEERSMNLAGTTSPLVLVLCFEKHLTAVIQYRQKNFEVQIMAKLPPDVEKLEQMYIAGFCNDELSAQAIVIAMRMRAERATATQCGDMGRMISLFSEITDFQRILKKIAGRDDQRDVLALYHKYMKEQKIVL